MGLDVPPLQPKVLANNQRTNEWIRRLLVAMAVLVLILGGITASTVTWLASRAVEQSSRNEALLSVVLAVTGCTVEDTPEECRQRQRDAQTKAIADIDCRARRRDVGLPAPTPGTPCVEQTPADVYPGATP